MDDDAVCTDESLAKEENYSKVGLLWVDEVPSTLATTLPKSVWFERMYKMYSSSKII